MFKGLKACVLVIALSLVLGGSYLRLAAGQAVASAGCDLSLKTFTGLSLTGWRGGEKRFTGSYLANVTQIKIQVSPNNCRWKVDRSRANTAPWLTTRVVSGNPQQMDGSFVGSAYIDLKAERNNGPARNTTIYFTTSPPGGSASYDSVQIAQGSIRDYCQPKPAVVGTIQNSIVEPGFLVLTKYGQTRGTPPSLVDYRFRDEANCATSAAVASSTPILNSPYTRAFREAPEDTFLIRHPGVNLSQAGGAILSRLGDTQSILQGRSAVFVRYLLKRSALPVDLQIDPKYLSQYVVAVTDGGGIVEITGHAVRSTSNPSRTCPFNPTYYHVVEEERAGTGTQWLKVASGTGCNLGEPDDGKLIISVNPSAPGVPRLGAIYADWGTNIMVVQR